MPRVSTGPYRRRKHQKILKRTKGFRMSYNRLIKRAKEAILHAGEYAYAGRKQKKRAFRTLWIKRINAGLAGIDDAPGYRQFITNLTQKKIKINRKILAHLAVNQPDIFAQIVKQASR